MSACVCDSKRGRDFVLHPNRINGSKARRHLHVYYSIYDDGTHVYRAIQYIAPIQIYTERPDKHAPRVVRRGQAGGWWVSGIFYSYFIILCRSTCFCDARAQKVLIVYYSECARTRSEHKTGDKFSRWFLSLFPSMLLPPRPFRPLRASTLYLSIHIILHTSSRSIFIVSMFD